MIIVSCQESWIDIKVRTKTAVIIYPFFLEIHAETLK
jgi:hypothetical protein